MKGVQPVWQRAVDEHLGLLRYWRSPLGPKMGGQALAAGRYAQRAQEFWRKHPEFEPGQAFVDAFLAGDDEQVTAIFKRSKEAQDRLEGKAFDRDREAAEVAQEQLTAIQNAATWAVTEDMMTLVSHASTTMPVETIEAVDLPCPNAFVYLGELVWMTSSAGKGIPHRALHWQAEGDQVKVVCYSARGLYGEGERPLSPEEELDLPRLYPGIEFDWEFGGPSWEGEGDVPQLARFLKALWTISAQRLAAVEPARPPRTVVRRAQREELLIDGTVRVVTLRRHEREAPDDPQERTVNWSHRWVVSGHWRNQWLPASSMHRLQWIDAHIKGPEDRPLVVGENVINVAR
jgi:hypothetical protein